MALPEVFRGSQEVLQEDDVTTLPLFPAEPSDDSMLVQCPHCKAVSSVDDCDDIGAGLGDAFCPDCGREFSVEFAHKPEARE